MTPISPPELGALLRSNGTCLFRVWAPGSVDVNVRLLGSQDRLIPLQPEGHGYHATEVPNVRANDRYLFELGNGRVRPDPASRSQPDGVHGPSAVVEQEFPWTDSGWNGPELADYVIYELHIGTFTAEGTFDAAVGELDRLKNLGITAVELMPVAQFPGWRNWGYDGVYPFAVQHSYGGPAGLKRLVDACHAKGLAVILDVVYNHLGPEGNYFRDFGPYFTDQYKTPWGDALNFDGPDSDQVRGFFLANALNWQTEFHLDALRLDAVHAIKDFSAYPFLAELADAIRERAIELGRRFHLIAESDLNDARLVRPSEVGGYGLAAMWSDDFHHAIHSLLTGERDGYYEDFGQLEHFVRAYNDGFTYSGQFAPHRNRRHGNSPKGVRTWQFVVCSQNHDQVGNRARGDRLTALTDLEGLKLAAGLVLLSPYVPLLFMGEEYADPAPFQYFVSHEDPNLMEAVRRGRREEFKKFAWQGETPDPQAETTFARSRLSTRLAAVGLGATLHGFYQKLLELRRKVPALRCRAEFLGAVVVLEKPKVMLARRKAEGVEVILAYHFGSTLAEQPVAWHVGRWRKILDSAATSWAGPGTATLDELASEREVLLQLPPRSFVVYQRVS
jgi:maltooligosyltrehalose trehalohydrolase